MRKKIFGSYIALIALLAFGFTWIVQGALSDALLNQYERQLVNEVLLAKQLMGNAEDIYAFSDQLSETIGVRVTIVTEEGLVIVDTDEDATVMSNHKMREEIRESVLSGMPSVALRYSDTVKADHLYAAVPVTYKGEALVLRISMPLLALKGINSKIQNIAMSSIAIATLLALLMAAIITKRITDPIYTLTHAATAISQGDYGKKIYTRTKDQIGALTEAFNQMSVNLSEAMSALQSRNSELEAILNSMINGVIAIDSKRQILLINKFCFDLLQLPFDHVVENESMYKIIRNEEVAKMIEEAIEKGLYASKELNYVHLDKILRIYVNPIKGTEGDILGSIVVLQDVTQIRKLELMRSDFVSNVSHELKTPLTSIKGFVDTLKSGAIDQRETALRFLDIIDIESDRLYRLINDILTLSEIERMDKETELTSVLVNDVAKEVAEMVKLRADEKRIDLILEASDEVWVKANRDRIKQLLLNLVDNAIKYTETGFVKITLNQNDKETIMRVEDSGVGFTEEHKERLFERFYRVDKGRSRQHGGTGLGLSIVKHIVLLYKGQIAVESKPTVGTAFVIKIPK